LNDALKQTTQRIALAKAAVPVLGERRVIGNLAVQPEPAEQAIRQIEMDLFAKPPLGADAHAVADDQHAHHRLGVDGGSAHVAVERLQRLAEICQIQVTVDAP
jgi:hypothetical protein